MDNIIYLITGVIAGAIGGMLGIGGSIFIIPALIVMMSLDGTYTGSSQHLIQSVGMICNVFIALPAAIGHWRAGAVMKDIIISLIPAAVLGVILGVGISNTKIFAGDNGKYLSLLLGIFLFYVSCYNAWKLIRPNTSSLNPADDVKQSKKRIFITGTLSGFLSGLLGIGGGSVLVPIQQSVMKVPLRNAIANSSCTIVFLVCIGATYKNATLNSHHNISWRDSVSIAVYIIPLAMFSSYFASKITHRINPKLLRAIFSVFMFIMATITFSKGFSK